MLSIAHRPVRSWHRGINIVESLNSLWDVGVDLATPYDKEPWMKAGLRSMRAQVSKFYLLAMSIRGDWKFMKQALSLTRHAGTHEAPRRISSEHPRRT